ncbi:MAG: protoporphyrinogen oxidase [Chlamydiales bacterium]|nr:protoporphyrinogen oxidase [Chlamydiales bacterium]
MPKRAPPHIVILGAGISGLSLGYFLKKFLGNSVKVTLLEKEAVVGGWMQTEQHDFLIEKGPRSFRASAVQEVFSLVKELSLVDQLLPASKCAKVRFLFESGKLRAVPRSLFEFLFSSFFKVLAPSLVKEVMYKVRKEFQEESIASFFTRHFGRQVTEIFVDALVSGVYAGDMHELSMNACFPNFVRFEQEYGSLVKGMLKSSVKSDIYSFKNGMQMLPKALEKFLGEDIKTNCSCNGFTFFDELITVSTNEGSFSADILCSTLPADVFADHISFHSQKLGSELKNIPYQSIDVVSLCYNKKVLTRSGFGYLVPSKEKEKIMGVIFESSVFPEQNMLKDETRLTVMLKGGLDDPLGHALISLQRHLNVFEPSVASFVRKARIPQYTLGHLDRVKKIEESLLKLSPNIHILGNAFYGVSINDCIVRAKKVAENIAHQL